jgi:hypothetical protein
MNARFENSQEITKISLLNDYELLGSLRLVAEKYNTSHAVVSSMMRRFGIVYKSNNHGNLPVNHDFFSNDTLKSCYWAGFIAADGCVFKNQVRLALAEKDIDHLRLFKKDLGSEHKLTRVESENSVCYSFAFCSPKMVVDLQRFGILPRKTKILKFPNIQQDMLSAFCRGYFDGDGCWAIHKAKSRPNHKGQMVFSTRGTEDFLRGMNSCFVEYGGLPDRCLEKSLNGWRTSLLQYNGNNICRQIANWLYSDIIDSDRYLRRKFDIVKDIL